MKFQGSQNYVATADLMLAVNAAITLKRPCWSKANRHRQNHAGRRGGPGAGHATVAMAHQSTTKAQQGLYEYDAVNRLRDSQLSSLDGGDKVKDINNYIVKACCGRPSPPTSRWRC